MTATPTGRVRVRTHNRLFREPLLVMQVEERRRGTSVDEFDTTDVQDYDYTQWRDATASDIPIWAPEEGDKK